MTRRATYKKSEVSQQQVLDAAIATIAARGLAQTSVQDIADAAGLSKGAVHYHFESKDDLLERVVLLSCDLLAVRVQAEFAAPGSPPERIRRALAELWRVRREGVPEVRVVMEAMTTGLHDERLKKTIGATLAKAREQVVEIGFKGLQEMGLRPRVSPEALARLLMGALDGLALHHLFDPATPETEAEVLAAAEIMAMALFELG